MKRKGAADSDADILLNNELHREQAWGLGQMGSLELLFQRERLWEHVGNEAN